MLEISESVDSLCRDGADLPRAPYIGKACTRLNGESLIKKLILYLRSHWYPVNPLHCTSCAALSARYGGVCVMVSDD